jgi:hypothetical protein
MASRGIESSLQAHFHCAITLMTREILIHRYMFCRLDDIILSFTPELNIEKLQMIVTAKASTASKVKWLEYLNCSASTCEARKLPPKPTNEQKLGFFSSQGVFLGRSEFLVPK